MAYKGKANKIERKRRETEQFRERFSLIVKRLELDSYKLRFIDLFRDSMKLVTTAKPEIEMMAGETKIGGMPDLPTDIPWPRNGEKPLSFVAQLNFCELPYFAGLKVLPRKGILFFFYDARNGEWGSSLSKKDVWRVIFSDNPHANLRRTAYPDDLEEEYRYSSCKVDMRKELTLPPMDSIQFERLRLDFKLHEKYFDLLSALCVIQGGHEEEPAHRILGHPDQIRRNVNLDCEMGSRGMLDSDDFISDDAAVKMEDRARDWRLLLQVDSDAQSNMCLGNFGKLYFMIKADDLGHLEFEKTWVAFQDFQGDLPDESFVETDDNEEEEEG